MAFQTDLLLTWLNCDQLPNYRCAEHYWRKPARLRFSSSLNEVKSNVRQIPSFQAFIEKPLENSRTVISIQPAYFA